MKANAPLLLILVLSLGGFAAGQTPAPPATEAPKAPEDGAWIGNVLKTAVTNMSRLTSFHVAAEVQVPGKKPTIEGDLGEGTLSLRGDDAKGNLRRRIVVGGKFYLSNDDGKTWGDDPDKQATIGLSNMVTGPISPELKMWEKATFTAKEVKVDGEDLLLLEKPAQGKEPSAQYWLVKDEKLGGIFIRKVAITISATDAEFPVIVRYTKLGEPVTITAPK